MKYSILILSALLLTISAVASAKDGSVSAAEGWNDSAGFQTSYDKLTKSVIAELIEKKENGFYDGFSQYNTYNIGAQTTSIGAQTIFTESKLDNVFITTNNCGEIVSSTTTDSTSINKNSTNTSTTNGAPCRVRVNNASNH